MSKTVHLYFAYDDQNPTPGLSEINKSRSESVFASLAAAGWPAKGRVLLLFLKYIFGYFLNNS